MKLAIYLIYILLLSNKFNSKIQFHQNITVDT